MPRVVAGRAGGIRLETNNDKLMRPTSDRMKEAIFSSIQSKLIKEKFHSFRFICWFWPNRYKLLVEAYLM